MGQSVRELKEQLQARGIDFSHCREKCELQELLEKAEAAGPVELSPPASSLEDGGFAARRSDGRLCWVDFVDGEDALCQWADGTDAIVPAADLEPLAEGELPGPRPFPGSFEEARAEAFGGGRLLVASVRKGGADPPKAERLQVLALASGEAAALLGENAVFWRGRAEELRETHRQQLAPQGAPSLAMVLPLAVDAMKVLWQSPGNEVEAVVAAFVDCLEQMEHHKAAAAARMVSEDAQLRWEQDEEYAAALLADQLAESRRAEEEAGTEAPGDRAAPGEALEAEPEAQPASPAEDEGATAERLAKARRLADGLAAQPAPAGKTARIVLRLPTGERVERAFGAEAPLSRLRDWAECCHLLPEAGGRDLRIPARFGLATAFPRREFGPEDAGKSLEELGLAPSAALLLVEKDSDDLWS